LDVGSDLDAIICGKSSVAGPIWAHMGHCNDMDASVKWRQLCDGMVKS